MTHAKIIFDEQPKSRLRYYLIFVLLVLLLAAYFVMPVTSTQERVELRPSALARMRADTLAPASEQAPLVENRTMSAVAQETLKPISPKQSTNLGTLPYGADALGTKGAWDGHEGMNESNKSVDTAADRTMHRDYLGRTCINDAKKLPIATLRTLVPPPEYPDGCGYRSILAVHKDILPSDFFSATMSESSSSVSSGDIAHIFRNTQWSTSDIERLIPLSMSSDTALELYILLRDRGSSRTDAVKIRDNFGLIDEFLRTGQCPHTAFPDGPCGPYLPKQ